MNPLIIDLIVAERSEEIRCEVQRLHLIAQYKAHLKAGRPSLWGRLRITLGNLLIRLGERLKSRYAAEVALPVGERPDRYHACP